MKGRPVKPLSLVLLPGLDGTGILFRPLVAALPADIKPIVVRYPPDRQFTYLELLPLVRETLPQSEPFILLGESFSGPLAVMIAADPPKNLIGLVLCATFVTAPIPFIGPVVPVLARTPLFRLFPPFQQLKALVGGYSNPELRSLFTEMYAVVRPEGLAARVRSVFRVDVRNALADCRLPILYIAGAKDFVVPRRNLRLIQRIHPGIEAVTIPSPHMVLQTAPIVAAEVIAKFASSIVRST